MTRQEEIDAAEVTAATERGYSITPSLSSSAHLLWRDHCRAHGLPYLAVFRGEATLEVDLRACPTVDLEEVRAIYRRHRINPDNAMVALFVHHLSRPRGEAVARDLWRALTRKE